MMMRQKNDYTAVSQVYNDSIFNEGELYEETNPTTVKNQKVDSN